MKWARVFGSSAYFTCAIFLCVLMGGPAYAGPGQPIVVDHTCTDITAIPQAALQQAKDTLHIAYGHTSHGSQLTTGMSGLVSFANGGGKGLSLPTDFFAYNTGGSGGALDLRDRPFFGANDLGNPDRYAWATSTRNYLDSHPECNVIIWSWCGQAATTTDNIDIYLNLMEGLIADYPNVDFVFMTGHLDGTGETGLLHLANEHIRNHCLTYGRILYDFADIESYDPDAATNYMPLLCNDGCYYDSDGNGSRESNWATEWQNSHVEGVDWYSCSSAHSEPLNANQKAYAAWWLWAWLGGWDEDMCLAAASELTVDANSITGEIVLNWTDNSHDPNNEDSFIIQRQVDGGLWNDSYDSAAADVTTWTETVVADGTYSYRVVAHLDDDGSGSPCNSSPSNVAVAVITSQEPATPSDLTSQVNGYTITLHWADNSDNEEVFVLERSIDGGAFGILNDALAANTTTYDDQNLAPLHEYTYRVKARNIYGDSDYSNTASEYLYEQTLTLRLESTGEVEDAFLEAGSPDTNYGSTAYLSRMDRYIVKFHFPPELSGAKIISADIAFYFWAQSNYQPNQYMDLYHVTRDWTESTTTWNLADTAQPWATPGGDYGQWLGEILHVEGIDHEYGPPVDLTDLVQKWVNGTAGNYGVLLVNDSVTDTGLKASEYSSGHTILDITYTSGCACILPGDVNYDCVVDYADFCILGTHWYGENVYGDVAPCPIGDGTVDMQDASGLALDWLSVCP